jgi:hypothetical protein
LGKDDVVLVAIGKQAAIARDGEEDLCGNDDVGIGFDRSQRVGVRQEVEVDEGAELENPEEDGAIVRHSS